MPRIVVVRPPWWANAAPGLRNGVILIPLLSLFAACTPAMMVHLREDGDRQALGEGVDLYWKAARWGDVSVLSTFLLEPADQLAVARVCASPVMKVTDTKILQVVVGPELVEPKKHDHKDPKQLWRTGTVLVQVEGYGLSSSRLDTSVVQQEWSLDQRGWHVNTVASPIDADRPW